MQVPQYELDGLGGGTVSRPAPGLVCFLKEDCPTCQVVAPLLQALYEQWGEQLPVVAVGQTAAGNAALAQAHALTLPLADDSALKVSFATQIDTVPTLFAIGADGEADPALPPQIGFVKADWQAFLQDIAAAQGLPAAEIDWDALPDWRPGCGSLSVDPAHADRLQAEADNSPIRARKLAIGALDDPFEFMFDQGFSDGLPLVPPTPERVLRMLGGTGRDPQSIVAVMPPNLADLTVEKIAINAVMAGCKPEYLPVVIAAIEAICTDEYNIHGVMATTMGASPVIVVNGPIRHRIDMNMEVGALGQGNRANATIGRAVRLTVRNVGGARPGGTERSTLGNPAKFTQCFAEWEERHPWAPLHVERGFAKEDSTVTVFTMSSGPVLMVDQDSRSGRQLAASFGLCLEAIWHPKAHYATEALVVVCPEHVDTFVKDGYDKADIRARIQEVTERSIAELASNDDCAVGFQPAVTGGMSEADLARRLAKFRDAADIHLTVAGGDAGKFSGAFHGWATGTIGSQMVTRRIDD
ncbi:MAG: TlpA family protein disulfide reductase [Pseudomonadota bacterium]